MMPVIVIDGVVPEEKDIKKCEWCGADLPKEEKFIAECAYHLDSFNQKDTHRKIQTRMCQECLNLYCKMTS